MKHVTQAEITAFYALSAVDRARIVWPHASSRGALIATPNFGADPEERKVVVRRSVFRLASGYRIDYRRVYVS